MRIHFFTANKLEDFRKHYGSNTFVNKVFEELHPQTIGDLDQTVFFRHLKDMFKFTQEDFESELTCDTDFPGLKLDFNLGLRLDVPEGNFRVKISDFDTGEIFFDRHISGGRLISIEQYFIRWHVEVFLDEEKIFSHTLNLEGLPVVIKFVTDALGDRISCLPYVREFKKIHRCDLFLYVKDKNLRELAARLCPDVHIVDEINFKTYASYLLVMWMGVFPFTPVDTRHMSIDRIGGMLLNINYLPPKANFKPTAPPVTNDPYVCIAVQSNITRKSWLYPGGWDIVIDYLKSLGYRVFCIDRDKEMTNDNRTIRKPEGAEDFTGNLPLIERANMLYHAEFFIGLSSGLSWLADAVNCPVVMICGFSQDWFEFYTPYRVANRRTCNGCFNDYRVNYLDRYHPCPYHKNTERELECQKKIPPRMVIDAIERLILDKNLIPPALRRNLS